LPKSNHFCLNFASILPKFRLSLPKFNQIYPNLINFAKKNLLEDSAASPAPTALVTVHASRRYVHNSTSCKLVNFLSIVAGRWQLC